MRHSLYRVLQYLSLTFASATTWLPGNAKAQTYPIDCAILLCLAGGWPGSEPCVRARAEFLRRITPWPVEPPLQIWRCPIGASHEPRHATEDPARIFDVSFSRIREAPHPSRLGDQPPVAGLPGVASHLPRFPSTSDDQERSSIQLVQDRATADISGPEFDFVRSIHVFHVRGASQYQAGSVGGCERMEQVLLGSYGSQGEFSWRRSAVAFLPDAHQGLERWGEECPRIEHRSVLVEWRDVSGRYGFEQVDY